MMVNTTAGAMVGKTVLVTGGTGGIGKATATGLAAMGARVGKALAAYPQRSTTVLHPGAVRTGFAAENPSPGWKVFLPLIWLFLKTPEKGAATSIYLASSPKVEGVTRTYFVLVVRTA